MDILTLELFDVTVSEALLEIRRVLEEHPAIALRIVLEGDEMICHNVQRFLERQGRRAIVRREGSLWHLAVAAATGAPAPPPVPAPSPVQVPIPLPVPAVLPPPPVLLTRAAFPAGDPALGRRLLLGVLSRLEAGIPWLGLAHEALELLGDAQALNVLEGVQERGVPVRISRESLLFLGIEARGFGTFDDAQWQSLLGRGGLTLL